jgi:hypothetical protein
MPQLNKNLQKLFTIAQKEEKAGYWFNVGHFAGWAGYCPVQI